MAQFYADIQGNRGNPTCMGTKNSGISGHIRGWNIGARVFCGYDTEKQKDFVEVEITNGSSDRGTIKRFKRIYEK